jgi:hypothetical protein
MPRIKTELLQAGMVVLSDVKNIDGMLLIPAKGTLSERQINILQAWGVAEIDVTDSETISDPDPLAKLSPEELSRLTQEVKSRFWRPDESNPVFAEIFKLMLQRRAGQPIGD